MEYATLRVAAERDFSEQLRQLFAAETIERIIVEAQVEDPDNPLLAALHGHGFKLTEKLAPRLYKLCRDTQACLGFTEAVEYFVVSDSELNCAAMARFRPDQPHAVIINSGLLERFDDVEMAFVVGHELGHLISRNSELRRLVQFVFPPGTNTPLFIQDKIDTWEMLAELTADRFGYIAAPDLDRCRSVFFKLSSGLDAGRVDFDPGAYQESLDEALEFFRKTDGTANTHPINPVRMKALQQFSESSLYTALLSGKEPEPDAGLDTAMDDLATVLLAKGTTGLTVHRKRFLATAGLLVAGVDDQISEPELERVLATLAHTTHFPRAFLDELVASGDLIKVFSDSVRAILEINPGERQPMLAYMVDIALADRRIREPEVEMLFDIGTNAFGFQRKEVAQVLAAALQQEFVPSFFN